MKPETIKWLNSRQLQYSKLCGKRPHLDREAIARAANIIYAKRHSMRPVRYAWEIWSLARELMVEPDVSYATELSKLKNKLYWYNLPWYEKLMGVGVYAEGGL